MVTNTYSEIPFYAAYLPVLQGLAFIFCIACFAVVIIGIIKLNKMFKEISVIRKILEKNSSKHKDSKDS